MKLAYSPTSPYVRMVMVVLHETNQLGDVTLDEMTGTPLAPIEGVLAANPLGKLPALMRDDGPSLYDSRVICAFLNDRAGAALYGSGSARWEIEVLEATAQGILDAALLMRYETHVRPEDKQMPEWSDGQWGKIDRALTVLNTRWMSHLSGPLDMGQIAVGCALGYLDFRHDARGWRNGNDALAAWFESFDSRPAMAATRPPEA